VYPKAQEPLRGNLWTNQTVLVSHGKQHWQTDSAKSSPAPATKVQQASPTAHAFSKDSVRIHCLGTVDELNSQLGLLLSEVLPQDYASCYCRCRTTCLIWAARSPTRRTVQRRKARQAGCCDCTLQRRPAAAQGVYPPGRHTRCQPVPYRTHPSPPRERELVTLAQTEETPSAWLPYLNRLSDLLFVLSRVLNRSEGQAETLWRDSGACVIRTMVRTALCPSGGTLLF